MSALEDWFKKLAEAPKCKHDGTTPPCAMCLIRKFQDERTKN